MVRTLLSERFAPITSSIGFLEVPIEDAATALEDWRRSLYPRVDVTHLSEGFPDMLRRLEPLMGGARPRELLVSAGWWTAYFDNGLRGTDAASVIGFLAEKLGCQGLAVDVTPHTVGAPGVQHGRMGAVQFELFGPKRIEFMNYVRTVSVAYDGTRWRFDANGTAQAFEEVEAYGARRVRDRFTSHMLERYCRKLGIDVFNPDFYGPDAVFMESDVPTTPDGYIMSLEEVQAWLEIRPGAADDLPG